MVYALCCLAAWQLRRRGVRMGGVPFRIPAAGLVIVLACLVIGWMLTSVTAGEWLAFAIAIAAATAIFLLRRGPLPGSRVQNGTSSGQAATP